MNSFFQCYFLYKRHTHFSTLSVYTVIYNLIIITWYTLYTTINCTPFYVYFEFLYANVPGFFFLSSIIFCSRSGIFFPLHISYFTACPCSFFPSLPKWKLFMFKTVQPLRQRQNINTHSGKRTMDVPCFFVLWDIFWYSWKVLTLIYANKRKIVICGWVNKQTSQWTSSRASRSSRISSPNPLPCLIRL